MTSVAGSHVRLAELVASLSLATDLGLGQPMEQVLRSCVLGLDLAEEVGLGESERAVVYYVALLAWLGCHADSYEQAAWFGDDIALRDASHTVDTAGPAMASLILRHIGSGEPVLRRARLMGSLLASRGGALGAMETTHCLVAGQFAMRLGLGPEVRDALQHVFERWDGKGAPAKLQGEQIALAARIVVLADLVEAVRRRGGVEAAVDVARRRAGGQLDPGSPSTSARTPTRCSEPSMTRPDGTRRSPPSPLSPSRCPASSSMRRSRRSPTSPTSSPRTRRDIHGAWRSARRAPHASPG
jgi:hypothetical protein